MKKLIFILLLISFQSCITAPLVLTTKSDTTQKWVRLVNDPKTHDSMVKDFWEDGQRADNTWSAFILRDTIPYYPKLEPIKNEYDYQREYVNDNYWDIDEPIYKFSNQTLDTIPCLLMYSDTTSSYYYDTTYYTISNLIDYGVYWMKGYGVREMHEGSLEVFSINASGQIEPAPNYYSHKEYLDDNKHPIKNSIIIWQAK
jgi:hypothetical protein